jgi:SAM-dependent methyltransferase
MPDEGSLSQVAAYYAGKLAAHGATPQGVDWNSHESQQLRFQQLHRICAGGDSFSVIDYGCGYGAFLDYLQARGFVGVYQGFDIAEEMIRAARDRHRLQDRCEFVAEPDRLQPADFVVASGVFNVKLETPQDQWTQYVERTVDGMWALCRSGMAFNVLTRHSDPGRMRPDLYYADPLVVFEHCRGRFSRFVALLHDYPLYEFTMLIRRAP